MDPDQTEYSISSGSTLFSSKTKSIFRERNIKIVRKLQPVTFQYIYMDRPNLQVTVSSFMEKFHWSLPLKRHL